MVQNKLYWMLHHFDRGGVLSNIFPALYRGWTQAPSFTLHIRSRDCISSLSTSTALFYKPDAVYRSHNLSSWAISVQTKFESRSRREHHHTYTCFSCRERKETNERLHEVDYFSEVPSSDTSRTIDKNNKIHTWSANWRWQIERVSVPAFVHFQ